MLLTASEWEYMKDCLLSIPMEGLQLSEQRHCYNMSCSAASHLAAAFASENQDSAEGLCIYFQTHADT